MADWKIRNNYNTMIIGPVKPGDLVMNPETTSMYLIDEELARIAYSAIHNGIRLLAHYVIDTGDMIYDTFYCGMGVYAVDTGDIIIPFLDVFSGAEFELIPEQFWD